MPSSIDDPSAGLLGDEDAPGDASFSDEQLFAARVLQRAGGLRIEPKQLTELLRGCDGLAPTWHTLNAGDRLPHDRVALLCDGVAKVTRPEDNSSKWVTRGALLNSDQLAQHLDAAPPPEAAAVSPARAPSKRRRSFSPPPLADPRSAAALSATVADEPCEVLSFDLAQLAAFLKTRRPVRLCVNALISNMKLDAYMALGEPDA